MDPCWMRPWRPGKLMWLLTYTVLLAPVSLLGIGFRVCTLAPEPQKQAIK